jgi:hypothetical protein
MVAAAIGLVGVLSGVKLAAPRIGLVDALGVIRYE